MQAFRNVPQTALLASGLVSVFVTHAGMNSIHESLWHGVPMVCVPHIGDQLYNASVVQDAGAGVMIDAYDVTVHRLHQAVTEVRTCLVLHIFRVRISLTGVDVALRIHKLIRTHARTHTHTHTHTHTGAYIVMLVGDTMMYLAQLLTLAIHHRYRAVITTAIVHASSGANCVVQSVGLLPLHA